MYKTPDKMPVKKLVISGLFKYWNKGGQYSTAQVWLYTQMVGNVGAKLGELLTERFVVNSMSLVFSSMRLICFCRI